MIGFEESALGRAGLAEALKGDPALFLAAEYPRRTPAPEGDKGAEATLSMAATAAYSGANL